MLTKAIVILTLACSIGTLSSGAYAGKEKRQKKLKVIETKPDFFTMMPIELQHFIAALLDPKDFCSLASSLKEENRLRTDQASAKVHYRWQPHVRLVRCCISKPAPWAGF